MVKPRELARALNASNRGLFARQLALALAPVAGSAQRLPRRRPLNRGIWIALGVVGLLALVAFGFGISAAVNHPDWSALDHLAPCQPFWTCVGDPSSADRANADEVARFLSTGIPSVIPPSGSNCFGARQGSVSCITFVGFGQQIYAGYPGQRCAPLDAVMSAAKHRTRFCSPQQRDAFSFYATIHEGAAAERLVRLLLSVLSVLTLLVPALATVVLAYASRTTIFRFELVLFPVSHVSIVLVALVFFVVYALVLEQTNSLLCCHKECSLIGSLTYMDGSRRSLADISRSLCTSALSKYRWDAAAVFFMLSVQALLYFVSIARSQADHYEHLTWIKALMGRAPSVPGSLRAEAAAAAGAEEEEQHEEQGHGQEQEQNKSRQETEDEMAMALLRGRCSSVGAAHLMVMKARPVCCCRDCLAIILFLAGSLTIAFAALTVELIGDYVDLFTSSLGFTFAIRNMHAWPLLVATIATIFAFGVAGAIVVAIMTIVNRQLIAWANRRGQLESRAAVSSENVSRLVIYSITFLILSLVLALMLFLAVTWILVTGTAPYIGCSLTAGGLVGNVVGSLIGILVEFADGPKHKDDDFRMWIAEHVNNAMTVAQNYTCSSQESQTAFALLTFALGLLRSTGVPLPPELELNVTQYTAMCTKLFTDVLTPVTNTAVEGGSTFIANLDQQGGVYCADLTVFGLPEYCTSAVADWCESNAPPLAKTSITAFGAGLLLLIVLLALLLSLPAMAAQSALGVMDELTVRELALAELHKALHDSQPNEEVPKEPDDGGEPRDDGGEPRAAAAHPSQVELTVPVAEPGRRSDIVIA